MISYAFVKGTGEGFEEESDKVLVAEGNEIESLDLLDMEKEIGLLLKERKWIRKLLVWSTGNVSISFNDLTQHFM